MASSIPWFKLSALKTFSFRQRLLITIGSTVAGALVLTAVNYWLMGRVRIVTKKIQQQRQSLVFRSRITEAEARLRSDLIKAQQEVAYLENILPLPDELIDFPRDLTVWGRQYQADVGFSFVSEVESTPTTPGYTNFILTVTGSLSDVFQLLKAIEGGRYLIKFNQYDIARDGNAYTLLINGQIFSR